MKPAMKATMAAPVAGAGVIAVVVTLFVSLVLLLPAAASQGGVGSSSLAGYVPVSTVVYRRSAVAHEPFQQCSECRCCPTAAAAGNNSSSSCMQTRCCYGIKCNIPGKPFGDCAFTPRSCGCGAAGNCTAPPLA